MTKDEYLAVLGALKSIIRDTQWEGHLYSVGGCVRDSLMGYPIKDIDLVVDLPNGGIDFANWLCDNHYLLYEPVTYPTYGTAMFKLLAFPELELEIVETRKEQYKDKESRNPDVVYGTLEDDCKRRDLTINALYYDITNGKIVDLVGGVSDINNKVIKTPSDPNVIFEDDPLRMMRVIRFSTRYYWRMHNLYDAIRENADRMKIITQERITDELSKSLMTANYPSDVLHLLRLTGLWDVLFPDCKHGEIYYNIAERQLDSIKDTFGDNASIEMYFAVLFRNDKDVLNRMKLSNAFIKKTIKYIDLIGYIFDNLSKYDITVYDVRKFSKIYGKDYDDCIHYIDFIDTYGMATGANYITLIARDFERWVGKLESLGTMVYETTTLPIDGNDIMNEFKLGPSKKVKELLDEAWEYFYTNPKISKENLLSLLKK